MTSISQSMKTFYVYIMASASGTLYVGVTSNLVLRVFQHKNKLLPGFTVTYDVTKLVYFEEIHRSDDAFETEKRLKKLHRWKKEALIRRKNPEWRDLAEDWYD